jgi:GTP diphosphokinase / guanosine-3',5'-bis(diphosphate) 3'-diphosphatase
VVRLEQILETLQSYAPDADVDVVMRAYLYAARAHDGQTRKSGEPYLMHPIAVAAILAEWHMDVDTIATGFLHDTMEDCLASHSELSGMFGVQVADMVEGVTKIGKLRFRNKEEAQAENFRKMILAMAKDIRVILVKLADRLHNMRTMEHMRPDRQKDISQETLDIFAPIANRLGLAAVKQELEDHAFRYLQPDVYESLRVHFDETAADRDAYILSVRDALHGYLSERELPCQVSGRVKHYYSVYRKMQSANLEVDQVHDLLAFRVFVDDLGQCYTALGFIHARYQHLPDRIKDYIAQAKSNGYQSLHTVVIGPDNRQIEIQIRTHQMHKVAEGGIAAHWKYKEGHLALSTADISKIARLRELFETAREVEDPQEFMEAVKVDLFANEIFVFTPRGDVKVLAQGATALDFAYAVHTEVGNRCTGTKVNGRIVPLRHELRNGDSVEVMTKPDQHPSRDWLEMAKTGRALSKIRRYVREAERERAREVGREMVEAELKRFDETLHKAQKAGRLDEAMKKSGFRTAEQLFLAVGQGHLTVDKLAPQLLEPGVYEAATNPRPNVITSFLQRLRKKTLSPVLISGQDDLMVSYAQCCNPLPGESVAGFITRGRGISVHLRGCPQLLAMEPERRVEVEWQQNAGGKHTGEIHLLCSDEAGMLAEIGAACKVLKINVTRMEARCIDDQKASFTLEVSVADVGELTSLMRSLQKIKGVIAVERVRHARVS